MLLLVLPNLVLLLDLSLLRVLLLQLRLEALLLLLLKVQLVLRVIELLTAVHVRRTPPVEILCLLHLLLLLLL